MEIESKCTDECKLLGRPANWKPNPVDRSHLAGHTEEELPQVGPVATDLTKANEPALRGVDGAEGPSEPAAGGLFRCLMDPPDGEEVTADIQYVYEALHDQGAHFSHESTEPRCCVTPRRSQGFEDSVITKLFPIYGMEPELEGILTCFSPRLPQPCSFISGVIPFLPAFSGSAALSSETSP